MDDPKNPGSGDGNSPVSLKPEEVQAMIDKTINGFAKRWEGESKKQSTQLDERFNSITQILESLKPKTDPAPTPGKDDPVIPPALKAQLDAERKEREKLANQLQELTQQKKAADEKAERTDREAAIKTEMRKFRFANPESEETVFDALVGKVKRSEDGSLIVDDTTMSAYLSQYIERRPNLIAAEKVNGTGSGPAGARTGKFQFENIRPGMSKEEIAQAAEAIRAAQGL